MSFLNPINEPVLRFSSTDASAPQINYAARTAGDIKAVLKACLVTGYGAKASAGWTAVNETATVIEFVSPSAAMSDYRLGIDDTSAISTTWYYQHQDVRSNPGYNAPIKDFASADKAHANNGWDLLVTQRGILFLEHLHHAAIKKTSTRITYLGQLKSTLTSESGINICFYNIGHSATTSIGFYFYSSSDYTHTKLGAYDKLTVNTALRSRLVNTFFTPDATNVDLAASIYLVGGIESLFLAELPPMLAKVVSSAGDLYGLASINIDGRNFLSVTAGYAGSYTPDALAYARVMLLPIDYWGY